MIIDPDNPDRMWVAAFGELYSANRGGAIYRTDNGGERLGSRADGSRGQKRSVGFVDLVMDDNDPNHLFAASWDRTRRAHDFTEGGVGTGIWETTDGGDVEPHFQRTTTFPEGPDAGRIGLGVTTVPPARCSPSSTTKLRVRWTSPIRKTKLKADQLFGHGQDNVLKASTNDQLASVFRRGGL